MTLIAYSFNYHCLMIGDADLIVDRKASTNGDIVSLLALEEAVVEAFAVMLLLPEEFVVTLLFVV
ncbi:hypothetical protein QR98_0093080 [Sarcoptes scabiei]|uniref:Uncharacterized protein n=1 Tax=Sarcoptes scabiei TaxID=52283 RepID=A0A132AII5_SARSC|nr:hypothetical protein QR98_0093080 [Sarcoptes scabiei]